MNDCRSPSELPPNESAALTINLKLSKISLWGWEGEGDGRGAARSSSPLPLCLRCGKVPGGVLGALPHGAHQPREAHVLWFLQPTHQPLLHDGDELLVAELPVPWRTEGRTGGDGEKVMKHQPVLQSRAREPRPRGYQSGRESRPGQDQDCARQRKITTKQNK